MIHEGKDVQFVTNNGLVKTSGYSTQLAHGEFGIFDMSLITAQGVTAVDGFLGKPKNTKFELKLGVPKLPNTRTRTNKAHSSIPFKLSEVKGLYASAPDKSENAVDELRLGFDGLNLSTALSFVPGDEINVDIILSGEGIGMLGYPQGQVTTTMQFLVPDCNNNDLCVDCDPCASLNAEEIVNKAILDYLETGGGTGLNLSDYIEVKAIKSTNTALSGTEFTFRTLSVIDAGDNAALALVQAQYPEYKIERTDRVNLTSVYTGVAPLATPFSAYTQTLNQLIKGCDACPSGYTGTQDGFVYMIEIEDEGANLTAAVDDLAGFVATTAVKWSQVGGKGIYTVVTDDAVTGAEITTFLGTSAIHATAKVELVGQVKAICENATVTSTAWVVGDSCFAQSHTYDITVPDTECGEDVLADIEAAYPELRITVKTVGEGELEEPVAGGCMTTYTTTVLTNMECEECTDYIRGLFISEAPSDFGLYSWEQVAIAADAAAKMGISFKGKEVIAYPDEYLRNEVPFVNSSTRIAIAAGFPVELWQNFKIYNNRWNVKVISRATEKSNMGGNMWMDEKTSNVYLSGSVPHKDNYTKMMLGEESFLKAGEQYVDFALEVERELVTQGFGGRHKELFTYHVIAPVGRHEGIQTLLNKLATAADIAPVQVYGV